MILLDANLLLYAYGAQLSQHTSVQAWLEPQLHTGPPVGLPWHSLLAFVRIVTHPRVFERPVSLPTAWTQVEQWLSAPTVWIPEPTGRHAAVLGPLLSLPGLVANDVPDAHLAALAIEHDLTLCSADTGFARFSGLRWENPLRSPPPRRRRQR